MINFLQSRLIKLVSLWLLLTLSSTVLFAEENMDYSTGSAEADKKLAKYIEGVKQGIPQSHAHLGWVYCGETCFNKDPNLREDYKLILAKELKKIKDLHVDVDYVRSYAHFILAADMKGDYSAALKILAKHMTEEQIEQAEELAKKWKSQFKREK